MRLAEEEDGRGSATATTTTTTDPTLDVAPNGAAVNGAAVGGALHPKEQDAVAFAQQAQRLAQLTPGHETAETGPTQAVEAHFVTPLDPVVETANGGRLPAIPVDEAARLNRLRDAVEGHAAPHRSLPRGAIRPGKDGTAHGALLPPPAAPADPPCEASHDSGPDAPLIEAVPPSRTNPLFPPLPMYGPPSLLRTLQVWFFQTVSAVLSLYFLLAIVLGAFVDAVPRVLRYVGRRATLRDPRRRRPFYEEEMKRAQERRAADRAWVRQQRGRGADTPSGEKGGAAVPQDGEFVPTEGGPDPLVVDVGYYARRVGLDVETFEVETEDGFLIELWHVFNPRDYRRRPAARRHGRHGPELFATPPDDPAFAETQDGFAAGQKKYPVLLMHGLLQSAGAYCTNDDDSLAFYLAKSGYDVWLGNNRCGFRPKHTLLQYDDPRMWAWNIRQMGVMDLPALISRVLAETGFPKLALIAHSQGTTETFVALAKEQRPEIGDKISVFCALAPAAYAGPLIGKMYFKFMRLVSPSVFRLIFGIHAFIPLMMEAHRILPGPFYGWTGYHVFSFLFNWSDARWDRGLRDRKFQWSPVYVSAESMRWWLGRECFAKHKCILATHEEGRLEDEEDEEEDEVIRRLYVDREPHVPERRKLQRNLSSFQLQGALHHQRQRDRSARGQFAWYDHHFPPLALWVCGADDLVDGRRLLRRFDRGREPHVRVVHQKIIEGYEHLDVIWAMDAIEKVGKEVREVIWRTADPASQAQCRVPVGCAKPLNEDPDIRDDVPMMHSGGRLRMASINEDRPPAWLRAEGLVPPPAPASSVAAESVPEADAADWASDDQEPVMMTSIDHSKEEEGEHDFLRDEERRFGRRMSEAAFTDLQEKDNPFA